MTILDVVRWWFIFLGGLYALAHLVSCSVLPRETSAAQTGGAGNTQLQNDPALIQSIVFVIGMLGVLMLVLIGVLCWYMMRRVRHARENGGRVAVR